MPNEHYAISAARDGFRRAGRAWSREATVVAAGDLTEAQVRMLRADPNITIVPTSDAPAAPPDAASEGPDGYLRGMAVADLRGWLIRNACGELDPGTDDHFTAAGQPATAALEGVTGLASISAAERDFAWNRFQAGQAAE